MKRVLLFAALAGLVTPLGVRADEPGIGQPGPDANVVAPDQPRGQLGGLASGAPSFSADLKTIGSAQPSVAAAPAAAAPAAAPAAGAPEAVSTTTTTSSQAIVEKQAISHIADFRSIHRIIHHCLLSQLRADGLPDIFGIPAPLPFAPIPAPFGDMELVSVQIVSEAVDAAGPIYRVSFRNNSPLPAHHFQVSLIAVLGEMDRSSPVVSAHIDKIGANAVGHIDIQMPQGVMSMGPEGKAAPFETLVAVVDSFDELAETTERNNIMTLNRIGIAVVEVASTTTTATAAPAAAAAPAAVATPAPAAAAPAPSAAAPAPAPAPAQGEAAPAQPEAAPAQPAPAPSGSDALDSLDLDTVESTSDLFVR